MTILAVETSAAIASAALLKDGVFLSALYADTDKKHAETAQPLIQELLDTEKMTLSDIDALAVDIGPGSFTGVRIGVCAVNAMAFARRLPIIAVDALSALAEPYMDDTAPICVLLDAGHGTSYYARFHHGACTRAPDAQDTAALLRSLPEGTCIVKDETPSAAKVARAAWRMKDRTVCAAVPMYVQPSQAERLFQKRREENLHA